MIEVFLFGIVLGLIPHIYNISRMVINRTSD